MCAADPDRFIGLGMVPLQDVSRAVRELERMVTKLGLRGVQIGTFIDGLEIGDRKLERFWAKAAALDIPVFVHPAGFVHPRFAKHLLWNSLGQPIEEAVAISSLIYEGVMDRHPGLKVCVAHGGGFLPFYTGRADRNFYDKRDAYTIDKSPTEYLKGFYYDTAFYNRDMLEFLVHKVGPSSIVMGADYPIGEDDPVAFVKKAKGLSARAQNMILGGNAAKLLNIS
jgi:aminocarboxymuconate-semialdehyde decarboxylase